MARVSGGPPVVGTRTWEREQAARRDRKVHTGSGARVEPRYRPVSGRKRRAKEAKQMTAAEAPIRKPEAPSTAGLVARSLLGCVVHGRR